MLHFANAHIGHTHLLCQIPELELAQQGLYSLVGANGTGKTSLFHSILNEVPLLQGTVRLEGRSIHEMDRQERARTLAFVPSRFNGVQHLKGWDYVAMGRAPHTNFLGQLNPEDRQRVDQVFDQLTISYLKDQDTSQMSDGERQILSIAQAIVQEAPLILLDEPTAYLDYPNRIRVLETLAQMAQKENRCIIQSTHDLELALCYSEHFLVLRNKQLKLLSNQPIPLQRETLLQEAFGTDFSSPKH
ncbi:MAG: ABC transporter ATP-binding protein [Bacteroidetes bacterium]|nr:MAG: ABC transporter ATP-binding protein [Bacteroidota bacterium]